MWLTQDKNKKFVILITLFLVSLNTYCDSQPDDNCEFIQSHCQIFVNDATVNYPNYADLKTPDLIQLFGYPVEEHKIKTQDGYILTVYRIPHSNVSGPSPDKIPVFCMHGIFASSAQWLWQPPNRALVFMLADAGFDVWIGNSRGTSYSQEHVSLSSNDPQNLAYWDFSSYEMGKYDVPAYINYVLKVTGQPSMYYIGHSLGNTQFLVAMTLYPELNKKIRTLFALAPAVYAGNTTNPFFRSAALSMSQYPFQILTNILGGGKFFSSPASFIIGTFRLSCTNSLINCGICSNVVFVILGYDVCQANFTTLPGLLAHLPDVTSAKTFSHASQAIMTGEFREYDYGAALNLRRYGQRKPRDYDLSKFDVPTVLYSGLNDNLVQPRDVQKLAGKLGRNVMEYVTVPYKQFNHLDFVAAKDADYFVYNHLIDIMKSGKYDRTR